jgi:hypothetical protein
MKLPDYPQKGKPVEQTIREIIDYQRMTTITNFQGGQMKQSRGGTTLTVSKNIRPRIIDRIPPFWTNFHRNPEGGYAVSVEDGRICELNRTALAAQDAIILHEVTNRVDEFDKLVKFAITVGQAIYIQVTESENGPIDLDEDIVLVVADVATTKSLNYIPTVQAGVYFYKLAELIAVGDDVILEHHLAGSHVYHESGLTADYRVMSCPDPVDPELYPQVQEARLRFCSGRLAGVDEDPDVIPVSGNVSEFNVETCT